MVEVVVLAARLVLAAMFLVSGFAKLIDQNGTRKTMIEFGVPALAAAPLALALPIVELLLAATLLPSETAWWAALGGLVLLGVFTAAVIVNLFRGRQPDCRCFGQLAPGPIGWPTLARNALFIAVAALVVSERDPIGPSAFAWVAQLSQSDALVLVLSGIGFVILALMAWLLLQLWQLIGRLLVRIDSFEARLATPRPLAWKTLQRPQLLKPAWPLARPHLRFVSTDSTARR